MKMHGGVEVSFSILHAPAPLFSCTQCLEHVERMNETAMSKRMLQGKIYATRKRGRPRLRWLEGVYDDLRKMKVKGCGGKMENREEWRRIVQGPKAHPEL
jgi:hypothetical protein